MAQFTLTWDNTQVLADSNAINQRAVYRVKNIGGVWIDVGFTPANDLDTNATTADTANDLEDNLIYQFKVITICTVGGPSDNDNGVQEMIGFACIDPESIDQTDTNSQITIDLTGTSVTKIRFTLKRTSDDVIMIGPTFVNKVAKSAIFATGNILAPDTDYYWEVELVTVLNNVQVLSSNVAFLGVVCGPYPVTTTITPSCDPITSMDVTSIEL